MSVDPAHSLLPSAQYPPSPPTHVSLAVISSQGRPKVVIGDESFDLEEIRMEEPMATSNTPANASNRKCSNSSSKSFRRKLSGCFRKQDSNEMPMLSGMPTSSEISLDDSTQGKKGSWYKKATSRIIRHRSVSEERHPSTAASQGDDPYRINVSQIELNDPRASSFNAIDDGRLRTRASSFLSASNTKHPPSFVASDSNLTNITRQPAGVPVRASYHGKPAGSLQRPFNVVVGSAESLVGRVLVEQGLGKYVDPAVLRATQKELAETLNMTQEGKYRKAFH